MMRKMRIPLLSVLLIAVLTLVACGQSAKSQLVADTSMARGAPAMEVEEGAYVVKEVPVEKLMVGAAAAATPAPPSAEPRPAFQTQANDGSSEDLVALVSQQRIIIRTVHMGLVVSDVAVALDSIVGLAEELGGWLVSSDRSEKHRGFVSIRVPADDLDGAVRRLRAMAEEVDSEVSTSQDVTDEYVDLTARLTNLQATEEALLRLLERAEEVEDALSVQNQLTRTLEETERLQGRIKFLEQTSAFSLVNVSLELAPVDMPVDAGVDQTLSVGQVAKFQATFSPPEDIEDFTFVWDFGDGSPEAHGNRTAPTLDEGTRITAVVSHVYSDDLTSPFIVEVEITGTGDAGVAESTDKLIATVTKVPKIEIFAGDGQVVREGEEVEFVGSFTRPEGLTDLTFRWEFGDGSLPVSGSLEEGLTRATATHEYSDHRPFAFTATLTITAQSDAGEVEASDTVVILVTESQGWTFAGWSAGDQGKTAVRVLSGVGQGIATFLIWLAIFSPVWIIGGLVLLSARRRGARVPFRRSRTSD